MIFFKRIFRLPPLRISILLAFTIMMGGCLAARKPQPEATQTTSSNPKDRLIYLQKKIAADQYDFPARLELGMLLFRQGEYQAAADELAIAVNLDSASKEALSYHGLSLLMLEKYYEALSSLQNAELLDPQSIEIKNNLGFCYLKLEEFDKAIRQYTEVLKLDPDNKVAHLNLGVVYRYGKQDFPKAIEHYNRYLVLEPESQQKIPILQWIQEQQKRIANPQPTDLEPDAMKEEERRRMAMQHFNAGLDAHRAGRLDEAYELWTRAVSLDPWNSSANYYLAIANCQNAAEALQTGLTYLNKALAIEPENQRFLELKAKLERLKEITVCP